MNAAQIKGVCLDHKNRPPVSGLGAALREAQSNISTIHSKLRAYEYALTDLSRTLNSFNENPLGNSHLVGSLERAHERLLEAEQLRTLAEDLISETKRAIDLQSDVDGF
ncbi:MAG: hypothetical protein ABSF22_09435 [Bryobacteraceae bacterium]